MARLGVARVGVAALVLLAAGGWPATARGQTTCDCCDCRVLDLTPDETERIRGPSQDELEALLAAGAGTAVASYILGIMVARTEPHQIAAVDDLPVVGAVASAARNTFADRNTSLLVFSAGLQAMGLLVVAAAATDLAALRRLSLEINAGPNGCGASVTWRFP